jgi:hypothetical protein
MRNSARGRVVWKVQPDSNQLRPHPMHFSDLSHYKLISSCLLAYALTACSSDRDFTPDPEKGGGQSAGAGGEPTTATGGTNATAGDGGEPATPDPGMGGAGGDAHETTGDAGMGGQPTVECKPGQLCECGEGDERECGDADVGNCKLGKQTCQDGAWGDCEGAVLSSGMVNDSCEPGDDANCNGVENEGCTCVNGDQQPCGSDTGNCEAGSRTCEDGNWGACTGGVVASEHDSCTPGDDSSCNGIQNEGCACTNGQKKSCGTNLGNCEFGESTCASGVWGACVGGVSAKANDACTTGDDANCNGTPNDGCSCQNGETQDCGTDTGACTKGTRKCVGGVWGACAGSVQPVNSDKDTCNQGDDTNCNGIANEGCACINGAQINCGSNTGNCEYGKRTCAGGVFGACVGAVVAKPADTCKEGDDANCNGTPNEGCACFNDNVETCGTDTGNCEVGTRSCSAGKWGSCNDIKPQGKDSCVYGDDATCDGWANQDCTCIAGEIDDCNGCGRRYCTGQGWGSCENQTDVCGTFEPSAWSSPYLPNQAKDQAYDSGCPGLWHISFDYDFAPEYFDAWPYYDHGAFMRLGLPGSDTDKTLLFYGKGSASFDVVGTTHWAVFSGPENEALGFTNIRSYCVASEPGVTYFAPRWQQPYRDIPYNGIDQPFDPGCPGSWKLTFQYDFQEDFSKVVDEVDHGVVMEVNSQTYNYYRGQGYGELTMNGPSHWAIWGAYSGTHHAGFTNVRAICN